MSGKRWTEMTPDEQVLPWGLLVDQLLLREELDVHDAAALECTCVITDRDERIWNRDCLRHPHA